MQDLPERSEGCETDFDKLDTSAAKQMGERLTGPVINASRQPTLRLRMYARLAPRQRAGVSTSPKFPASFLQRAMLPSVGCALLAATVTAVCLAPLYGLSAFLLLLVVAWFLLPVRPGATPKWLTVFLFAMAFTGALPTGLTFIIQALALAGSFVAWLRTPAPHRRGGAAVIWTAVIFVFWALLILHPNVPSLAVGLMGYRKTVFLLAGLVAGAAVCRALLPAVELTAMKAIASSVAVSIFIHLVLPSVEGSISRDAGEYTGLLNDQPRLQGVFAGPFHAAAACLVLVAWGLIRIRSHRTWAVICLLLGTVGMYLTLVRTAYVVLALVVASIILSSTSIRAAAKRTVGAAVVVIVAVTVVSAFDPAALRVVDSIAGFSTDSRFLGRIPGYLEGVHLFAHSPLFGWGSGSAGDTLGNQFSGRSHITAHNIILKVAVEGGVAGLALWTALLAGLWKKISFRTPQGMLALACGSVLVGFGMAVSSLEALPISWFICFVIGFALNEKQPASSEILKERGSREPLTVAPSLSGSLVSR